MQEKKPAITGSIDKDQLYYDSNFNPQSVSYVGPRVNGTQQIITFDETSTEDIQ